VDIAGARLGEDQRREIDAAVEACLDQAIDFALRSPRPDPAGALDHLYATGLKPRLHDGSR
jgi:pyruvate dehydrogenase E1 component alpha subunit